jgi:tryptophan synthase alpha chain
MGRIGERFAMLRARGERALIPFLTAGDPDLAATHSLVLALARAGADLIEIGIPFSDPLGDGPVVQRANERALRSGTSLRRVLELVGTLRSQVDVPLVLMGYANPILAMGRSEFVEAASAVGVDGVIVVDLPPEEDEALFACLAGYGVDPILLAAPTTEPKRLAMLADRTRGFLYYVSLTGVTGARNQLARGIEESVRSIRISSNVPVCVGFGVSTPEHVRELARFADGVVVGSALIEAIQRAAPGTAVDAAASFVAALKAPLRAPASG